MATSIYVQFSDNTDKTIVSVFSGPQDADVWQNLGEVQSDDARYVAYFNAQPSFIQKAMIQPTGD